MMRDGARRVWEKFATIAKQDIRKKINELQKTPSNTPIPAPTMRKEQTTSDDIVQKGKMI